jgi:hypothetical protein
MHGTCVRADVLGYTRAVRTIRMVSSRIKRRFEALAFFIVLYIFWSHESMAEERGIVMVKTEEAIRPHWAIATLITLSASKGAYYLEWWVFHHEAFNGHV